MKPKIENAPGLRWRQRKSGIWVALWIARPDIVRRGFRPETQELWRGSELDELETVRIQGECIRLQDEMRRYLTNGHRLPTQFDGTFGSLIEFYQGDKDSPYHKLRHHSRKAYDGTLKRIRKLIGDRNLSNVTFRDLKGWYEKARWPQGDDGPDHAYGAHFFMTVIRFLVKFGSVAELYGPDEKDHCLRLSTILKEMEFEGGRPRWQHLDRDMAGKIITEAPKHGRPSVALAQALQFELNLRQKDVIGEWVPLSEPGTSEYLAHGKKWIVGLDWRNVSADMILTHTLSKSIKGRVGIRSRTGKRMQWDLKLYPLVMAEIEKIPEAERHGAMVKEDRSGLPWFDRNFRDVWRKIAKAAGVPDNVKNMDSRAGGITETIEATAGNLDAARKSAGHSNVTMTQRYSRDTLGTTSKVAVLRAGLRKPENDG